MVAWSAKDFRSYGYRPVLGRPGVLKIDEAEAAVVRRICRDYLGSRSPRDIAVALNKGRISAPRGGARNASTIGGSRTRRNGILQNELYGGRIVWNRQRFIKDPETGKRVSRPNSPDQWMTAEAEQLPIVDAKTWQLRTPEMRLLRLGLCRSWLRQARYPARVLTDEGDGPVREQEVRGAGADS